MLTLPKNCIVFTYPKMGKSREFLPDELKNLAGLTGCTNQCNAYQKSLNLIENLGFKLIAISSQNSDAISEFKDSLGLGFEFVSDPNFELENELNLKTFSILDGKKFYHRQTLIFKDGNLIKRFDFVASPSEDAKNVVEFLKSI
ncbi:peroxiredoxin domain-containing protein [Campylobacter iguaniorum]|uniref:Peroxiredoxin domain-containing protein n=1 Tax=Campylobacter iguaniorum TaxID=1244531 RepID=A0A076FB70_9BACT|nr:redoxin domain-containing protein [Campylobacter iguaniorum]AII14918.1 peroxiredoxin domain-containing protein [Campylobacter iguaniorum]